jgi:hypothetical protein
MSNVPTTTNEIGGKIAATPVRIVAGKSAANEAGQIVESIPINIITGTPATVPIVQLSTTTTTDETSRPIAVQPARLVAGLTTTNSAGQTVGVLQVRDVDPLSHIKAMIAGARAGTASPRIALVGTSRTRGVGADSGDNSGNTDGFNRNVGAKIAAALAASGLNVTRDSVFGTQGDASAYSAYNPRTTGANNTGWIAGSGSLGGGYWRNSTNSTPWTITNQVPCNQIDIEFPTQAAAGIISYSIDGEAPIPFTNGTGTSGLVKVQRSVTLGYHTVTFARVSGLACFVDIEMWDTTAHQVRIWNMGWASTSTANWADSSTPYSPSPALAAKAPDLTILELGTNDWAGNNQAAYRINLQTVITAAKAGGGSVIIVGEYATNGNQQTINGAAFNAIARELADLNGCVYVDQMSRFVDYPTAAANGYMWDGVHANENGQTFEAIPLSALLLAA